MALPPSEVEIERDTIPRREMPRADYKTCKACGQHAEKVGPLSHTRLCGTCSVARERQCIIDLATHNGVYFQYWRARIAASVGYGPLDDMPAKP